MCWNDELSLTMSWVGFLLRDSELFILLAENSQIPLKISVIPILLTFISLEALNLLVNNQLSSLSNSTQASLWHIIVTIVFKLSCAGIAEFFDGHKSLIIYPNFFFDNLICFKVKIVNKWHRSIQNISKKIRLLEKPGWKENNIRFLLWFSTCSRMLLIVGLRWQGISQKTYWHLKMAFINT